MTHISNVIVFIIIGWALIFEFVCVVEPDSTTEYVNNPTLSSALKTGEIEYFVKNSDFLVLVSSRLAEKDYTMTKVEKSMFENSGHVSFNMINELLSKQEADKFKIRYKNY